MKLTLHLGHSKTGSTSIQVSFFSAREDIAKYGCLYPAGSKIRKKHHWLAPLIFDRVSAASGVVNRMGYNVDTARKLALEEWQHLLTQIRNIDPDELILSSEVLFRTMTSDEVEKMKRRLGSLATEVQVFAYIRSPAQWYLARVQQGLKRSSTIAGPAHFSIMQVLKGYMSVFDCPVKLRVFEKSKLLGGDVVRDFVDWAALPFPHEMLPKIRMKNRISAECMAALQETMPPHRPKSEREFSEVRLRRKALIKADTFVEAPTAPVLKPEVEANITAQCPDLIELRDEFALNFDDVDYGLFNSPPPPILVLSDVGELCNYDSRRKEVILAKAKEYYETEFRNA